MAIGPTSPPPRLWAQFQIDIAFEAQLVELGEPGEDELARWIASSGWERDWAVFIVTGQTFRGLRRHLRKLEMVQLEGGSKVLFRHYDPRVLRAFLPTCDAKQLEVMFGPVLSFLLPARDPRVMLELSLSDGELRQERIALLPDPGESAA